MTNNKPTDEFLEKLATSRVYPLDRGYIIVGDDLVAMARELQERRAADKNYFMFGIATPEGNAYLEEFCVSSDRGLMEDEVAALNDTFDTNGYRVVALYTALPLTDSERVELQERRKVVSAEPVAVNDDMAYAFHHALSDSSLGADEVEEIKSGLRAAFANVAASPAPIVVPDGLRLALSNAGIAAPESDEMLSAKSEKLIQALVTWVKERKPFHPAPVVPDEIEPDSDNTYDYVEGWNACRSAMLSFRENKNSSTETFREIAKASTDCLKCGGCGTCHCLQMLGTVECECTKTIFIAVMV